MITSLNVNQFLKSVNWEELQGKYNDKYKIWIDIKDYYFRYISDHILTEEDLLIFHEVPFVKEIEYKYRGEIKFKRSEEICKVYQELKEYCEGNGLKILEPSTEEKAFFRTIAIFKEGAYKRALTDIDKVFKKCANRIIALERAKETIIGVHIPKDCKDYWDYLIEVHQKLPRNKRIIYVGDLNTYSSGTINKNKFYELLSKGLIDVWIEKGNPHTKECSYVKI